MAGFSADWLALREPADHAARSTALTRAVAEALAQRPGAGHPRSGCGTGSNFRFISARGPACRRCALAAGRSRRRAARARSAVGGCRNAVPRSLDAGRSVDLRRPRAGHGLGAARSRVRRVAPRARRSGARTAGAAVLFALNYDGRIICTPEDADDGTIVALVNQHQQTDKGFGPALGPDADRSRRALVPRSTVTRCSARASDWMLTPASGELQRQLIDGWTQAATEIAPEQARLIDRWRERRLAHLAAGWSQIVVGHEDRRARSDDAGNRRLRVRRRRAVAVRDRSRSRTARRCPSGTRDSADDGSR